ncbi:MAG: hypothetical protein Q4C12_04110 [Clostridia bacterium]|nr:hypothetical protein [Clostridia bacterium]
MPYTIEIHADIDNATYSAYVIGNDAVKEQLAENYKFRSSAKTAQNLGKICVRSGHNVPTGAIYTENFKILSQEARQKWFEI